MAVPNLDNMSMERLSDFSDRHHHGRNFGELFPGGNMSAVHDTWTLSLIAHFLMGERLCRSQHDIPQAVFYKSMVEEYYSRLSPRAKWRK